MSLVSRRADIMALVLAAAVCALVLGYYHDGFWWPADDGAYAHVADRILRGEVALAPVTASAFGVVTVLLGRHFLREEKTWAQWSGIVLIFAGVAALSWPA